MVNHCWFFSFGEHRSRVQPGKIKSRSYEQAPWSRRLGLGAFLRSLSEKKIDKSRTASTILVAALETLTEGNARAIPLLARHAF